MVTWVSGVLLVNFTASLHNYAIVLFLIDFIRILCKRIFENSNINAYQNPQWKGIDAGKHKAVEIWRSEL